MRTGSCKAVVGVRDMKSCPIGIHSLWCLPSTVSFKVSTPDVYFTVYKDQTVIIGPIPTAVNR